MLRYWETLGQALVDTNFRRYRILTSDPGDKKEKALPRNHKQVSLHDRINKVPGRHSLSRFEVGEILRIFGIQKAVDVVVRICQQWYEFCKSRKELVYSGTSPEFNRALGLAASDTSWVKKIVEPDAENHTENVHFDLAPQEWQSLVDFLRYKGKSRKTTAALLEEFETHAWRSDCPTSVTLRRTYVHPTR